MSTLSQFKKLINHMSKIVHTKITLVNSTKESEEITGSMLYKNIILEGQLYSIYIDNTHEVSSTEQALIKFIIEDYLKKEAHILPDGENQSLVRLIYETLSIDERKHILEELGMDKKHLVAPLVLKLKDISAMDETMSIVKHLTGDQSLVVPIAKDYLLVINQHEDLKDVELAQLLVETIETEIYESIKVGIGTPQSLVDLKKSYEEAIEALNLGLEFRLPGHVYDFNQLVIYRLLAEISQDTFKAIYDDLEHIGIQQLEDDDIKTVHVFLENNLNISEAARKLYIHRNTLIYRLEKIHKMTGFDLRSFEQALEFKLLLIIHRFVEKG